MGRRTRHAALVDSLCGRLRAWTARHAFASRERDPEGRTWYRIENAASGPADVFIYGEIGFWGVTAEAFLSDLGQVGSRDITLRINSEGGEVFDGVAIYNALQRHPGRIEGHVDGLAASAASFIAMACDELIVEPGAQLMIHDAIGMCYGNAAEMTKMVDMLHRTSDTIAAIYAERAGGEAASWRALMSAEDTWYDGPAAVAAGLADRVGEGRDRRAGPTDRATPKVAAYYGEAPGERDGDGRFKDGMPDVVASYGFATVSGSLTASRTRNGVELSDGAHAVTLRPHESRRLERAMRNGYATEDTLITRHEERSPGEVFSVVVARVRPQGSAENDSGEMTAAGMRLDIGVVEDPDDYDQRTGVTMTAGQADRPFADALGNAEVAARVQTGYGPLDMFPAAGNGMGLRMKGDSGAPVEVRFPRAEWRRLDAAINTVIEGFIEDGVDDAPEINKITVSTKAGKVDVEWSGPRIDGGGYSPDSKLRITPQYDAPWSVVIDGDHMSNAFDPIGHINAAIGIDNRSRLLTIAAGRQRSAPTCRPRAVRSRVAVGAVWPLDWNPKQARDDDTGEWTETPGTGMSWESYSAAYDVYDESATSSGLTIVTMSSREMQFAFDDAQDGSVRHVLLDFAEDDNGPAELRDALRAAIDSDEVKDFELVESDSPTEVWANVTRNEESITLSIPGSVERNDFEIEIDLDEAGDLADAIDAQIERYDELQYVDNAAPGWASLISAWQTPAAYEQEWAAPEWASAHSTPEPVSSRTDDHLSLWEAWA